MNVLETVRGRMMTSGFRFGRPLVLLQSDDWGRVGVRDQEGVEHLRAAGLNLGDRPYDLYSLETAEDVGAVAEMLESLRDSAGEPAKLEMNFLVANVDFHASAATGFRAIVLKPLVEGLPNNWRRNGLFEAYRSGIDKGIFSPALHGATHFCQQAVIASLAQNDQRGELLRMLWKSETPYIHWRMPWVGYEYWDPSREPARRFISSEEQARWIAFAADSFHRFFGDCPISACAPGYRANNVTWRAWRTHGVRIAQNGPGTMHAPHFDGKGLLHTYRSLDFEPALNPELRSDNCLATARSCFAAGLPFIISVHSINFHSTLASFRQRTVPLLSKFLRALKKNFPDLLYLSSKQLLEIIETGAYQSAAGRIQVPVQGGKGVGA